MSGSDDNGVQEGAAMERNYGLGYRLLQSMGWSRGKGLGKQLNGLELPVSALVKTQTTVHGLGFKRSKPITRRPVVVEKTPSLQLPSCNRCSRVLSAQNRAIHDTHMCRSCLLQYWENVAGDDNDPIRAVEASMFIEEDRQRQKKYNFVEHETESESIFEFSGTLSAPREEESSHYRDQGHWKDRKLGTIKRVIPIAQNFEITVRGVRPARAIEGRDGSSTSSPKVYIAGVGWVSEAAAAQHRDHDHAGHSRQQGDGVRQRQQGQDRETERANEALKEKRERVRRRLRALDTIDLVDSSEEEMLGPKPDSSPMYSDLDTDDDCVILAVCKPHSVVVID